MKFLSRHLSRPLLVVSVIKTVKKMLFSLNDSEALEWRYDIQQNDTKQNDIQDMNICVSTVVFK